MLELQSLLTKHISLPLIARNLSNMNLLKLKCSGTDTVWSPYTNIFGVVFLIKRYVSIIRSRRLSCWEVWLTKSVLRKLFVFNVHLGKGNFFKGTTQINKKLILIETILLINKQIHKIKKLQLICLNCRKGMRNMSLFIWALTV